MPRRPPVTDSARGIGLVDLGTGPGKDKGGARPRCHAGGGQLPTPELKPVPPSRRPTGIVLQRESNFLVPGLSCSLFWLLLLSPPGLSADHKHPNPPALATDRFIFVRPPGEKI